MTSCSWSAAACTTRCSVCPTVVTPMPAPKSMKRLPSTSTRMAPFARSMYTGSAEETPADTTFARRACSSSDFGPGMAVTT